MNPLDKEDKEKIAEILEESRRLKKEMNYQQISNALIMAIVFLILYRLSPANVMSLITSGVWLASAIFKVIEILCDIVF